jgi:hypothetical protein
MATERVQLILTTAENKQYEGLASVGYSALSHKEIDALALGLIGLPVRTGTKKHKFDQIQNYIYQREYTKSFKV